MSGNGPGCGKIALGVFGGLFLFFVVLPLACGIVLVGIGESG